VRSAGASPGLTGAVTLAARAATRSGAGYVQCAVPAGLNAVLEVKLTEEMTLPMPESRAGTLAATAADAILRHAGTVDALVVGSGLSRDGDAAALARRLAGGSRCALLIDADGLNAVAPLAGPLARAGGPPAVLTPHVGEMARLTGVPAAALEDRRLDACREWAMIWGAVVVLKGAPTVIAAPDGRASVNPTGNPGMATAGMGDVLSGVIAALLARGLAPWDAARAAVWAHGAAGDACARDIGPAGYAAGEVADALPGAFARLAKVRDAALERGGATEPPAA
jgi:hydroxyethylthiazole kinase-like uncharacterized protein yjeF